MLTKNDLSLQTTPKADKDPIQRILMITVASHSPSILVP
jgi:hypothetical protein